MTRPDASAEVSRILREDGAELIRTGKHNVWRLSNGQNFVTAQSPSDYRAADNQLRDLRHRLGLVDSAPKTEGERRERKNKPGRFEQIKWAPGPTALGAKLIETGILEESLRQELQASNLLIEIQRDEIAALKDKPCECWWCRLMARLRGAR